MTAAPGWVKEKVSPSKPITVTVAREKAFCNSYVVPKSIKDIGVPPKSDGSQTVWSDWNLALGGAEMDWTKVLITVRGKGKSPVTVTGLDFAITDEGPPLKGSYLAHPCGDETVARFAEVDLDRTPPRIVASSAVPRSWGDDQWRTTPLVFPYEVSDTDSESLLVIAKTSEYRAWTAVLTWTDGDKSGSEKIDWEGKPFKTSAITNAVGYTETEGKFVRNG
ncbi:hypothetical protein Acsp02_63100 [Actinoplanes sp. NBRC 103695]|nr:hypothetical protein Acsp02_63100 [Actinoplanes sp. NBRC 103695]